MKALAVPQRRETQAMVLCVNTGDFKLSVWPNTDPVFQSSFLARTATVHDRVYPDPVAPEMQPNQPHSYEGFRISVRRHQLRRELL